MTCYACLSFCPASGVAPQVITIMQNDLTHTVFRLRNSPELQSAGLDLQIALHMLPIMRDDHRQHCMLTCLSACQAVHQSGLAGHARQHCVLLVFLLPAQQQYIEVQSVCLNLLTHKSCTREDNHGQHCVLTCLSARQAVHRSGLAGHARQHVHAYLFFCSPSSPSECSQRV